MFFCSGWHIGGLARRQTIQQLRVRVVGERVFAVRARLAGRGRSPSGDRRAEAAIVVRRRARRRGSPPDRGGPCRRRAGRESAHPSASAAGCRQSRRADSRSACRTAALPARDGDPLAVLGRKGRLQRRDRGLQTPRWHRAAWASPPRASTARCRATPVQAPKARVAGRPLPVTSRQAANTVPRHLQSRPRSSG